MAVGSKKSKIKPPKRQTSRREKFTLQTIHRSRINPAPYNPRVIDDEARDRLRKGLVQFGLVEPLVWNQRTGNLVSGHQRLKLLDETGQDYELTVSVIDVDEATEKKLNVLLNNRSAQGMWDQAKLDEVLLELAKEGPAAIQEVGFSVGELREICESVSIHEVLADIDKQEKQAASTPKPNQPRPEKPKVPKPPSPDLCLMVIFQSAEETTLFLKNHQLPLEYRCLDAERFMDCVGIKLQE